MLATVMTELNPQQQIAVDHVEGPLLVIASAGSGKTRVVTYRISHLLELGIPASEILAVTFTNKAADEMRHRIRMRNQAEILACTFHSLGARILRESIGALWYKSDFAIYDEEDSEKLLKGCLEQLQIAETKGMLREVRTLISKMKNDLLDPIQAESASQDPVFLQAYPLYQKQLQRCNALDFDDLLYLTVQLLRDHESVRQMYQKRWQFVLIDEYQDTNLAQYQLIKLLVAEHRNLFAVGDPDQSIYSWRGARYQNILNFEQDFPGAKVVTLDQNYRSTNTILKAANALIHHNNRRYDKELWSALGDGAKVGIYVGQNEKEEAHFVANRLLKHVADNHIALTEIAIFYRTNAQSRAFEDALLSRRIAYEIIGGVSFYQRREIKDLLAWLRMIVSDSDLISFLRTINLPKRGLGPATLEKISQGAADRGIPIFTFCADFAPGIKLSAKQQEGLRDYVSLIHALRHKRHSLPLHELLSEAITASRYLNHLQEDSETFQDRKENLDELIGKAAEWEQEAEHPSLTRFLEELTLRSNVEKETAGIKLMTLHNSKGLEFQLVFLVGLEEDILPHANSRDSETALEEERRLCYVGMTRAKRFLYLCSTTFRYLWGVARPMRPSRFLKEIPADYLQNQSPTYLSTAPTENTPHHEVFDPGDVVWHSEFGTGTIDKAYQGSFGLTYDVYFHDTNTKRTLVAKYAKLKNQTS